MSGEPRLEDFVLGPHDPRGDARGRAASVDPVTLEVIRHKLEQVNEEQAIALKDVSVSPIVTAASDFNIALFTADGRIASMGSQVVFHSGAMPVVLRHVMADFAADEIGEGDMFVVNDPYKGAVHHPDVSLMAPIHHEAVLVAWAGVAAHQVDMGGMSVGSISVRAREKVQEGLMMPPIKLIEGGRLRRDVWRLILNMTRQPQMVGLDLRGFVAANVVARERLLELIGRYGAATVLEVMEELIRYSEARMRERVAALPDGDFASRGYIDHDGIENRVNRVEVRMRKRGELLRFDLSGSSPQTPGYVNCTEGCLVGAVFGGVAPLLGHGIPWNQGILNAIEVVAPVGSMVNARPPAATGAATIGLGFTVSAVTSHVVSKLLALSDVERRHSQAVTHGCFAALFTGDRNQHGEPYGTQLLDAQIGGGGATAVSDGLDQSGCFIAPRPHIANVETNELHGPMLFLYRTSFPDTGGDGELRGGRAAGTAWTPYGVERLRGSLTAHGVEVPVSLGQLGGWPGVCNRQAIVRGTRVFELLERGDLPLRLDRPQAPLDVDVLGGEVVPLAAKVDEFELRPGDVVEYTWQGGGGYGDPLERAPERVERDVALGLISGARAASMYGVVPGDPAATAELRALARAGRLASAESRPCAEPRAPGAPLTRFGAGLVLARGPAGLQLECACGHVLCPARASWKQHAARSPVAPGALPAGLVVHEALVLVRYLCPACGRQHAIDVEERGAGPLDDFRLTGDWPRV